MELQALKLYLMSRYGVERVDALFWEVSPLFALCSPGWTRYVYVIVIHTSLYAVLTLSAAATILLCCCADAADHDPLAAGCAPNHDHRQALLRAVR